MQEWFNSVGQVFSNASWIHGLLAANVLLVGGSFASSKWKNRTPRDPNRILSADMAANSAVMNESACRNDINRFLRKKVMGAFNANISRVVSPNSSELNSGVFLVPLSRKIRNKAVGNRVSWEDLLQEESSKFFNEKGWSIDKVSLGDTAAAFTYRKRNPVLKAHSSRVNKEEVKHMLDNYLESRKRS